MKPRFPLSFAISLLLGALAARAGDVAQFTATFTGPDYTLVFPCPDVPLGGRVYRNMMFAIEILRVVCDGKELQPEKVMPLDLPEATTVAHPGGGLVYTCSPKGTFASAKLLPKGAIELYLYTLPRHPTSVSVQYRFRTEKVTQDQVYCVTSLLECVFPAEADSGDGKR